MRSRSFHLSALGLSIAGLELAAAFGTDLEGILAYALAAALGLAVYVQGERHLVTGSVFGNVLLGYAAGTVLGLITAAGLLAWVLSIPLDFALWRSGVVMWGAWAGVGSAVLSAYFVAGLFAMLR